MSTPLQEIGVTEHVRLQISDFLDQKWEVGISYTIFECSFIFSVPKLLLNAASYDGEIWHADA